MAVARSGARDPDVVTASAPTCAAFVLLPVAELAFMDLEVKLGDARLQAKVAGLHVADALVHVLPEEAFDGRDRPVRPTGAGDGADYMNWRRCSRH